MVEAQWSQMDQSNPRTFLNALNCIKHSLHAWSRRTFGMIPKEIGKLRQQILDLERNVSLVDQLKACYSKLQQLTDVENEYWHQRTLQLVEEWGSEYFIFPPSH